MPKRLEITPGDRYGKLVIVQESGKRDGHRYFLCECDCGNKKIMGLSDLRTGHSKSCGCLKNDATRARFTTHGLSGGAGKETRLYKIWKRMRQRCGNPNHKDYKYYGGRSITVCEEWNNYKKFYDWAISNGYRDDLTIDRIDNNGNYGPDNCKWSTRKEQVRNSRHNRRTLFNGKMKITVEWAEALGIKSSILNVRFHRGWTIEKALTTPVRATGR